MERRCYVELDIVLKAVDEALVLGAKDATDAVLRAVNAMPVDSPDFDCGIAAGLTLARYLSREFSDQAAA